MKLLIVRHADPDYEKDSLTETGWKEAELLSRWLSKVPASAYYTSPLGRAKDTASLTLSKLGRTATELDWLREFPCQIRRPDQPEAQSICWDWLPQDWLSEPRFLQAEHWFEPEVMANGNVKQRYDAVISGFDSLLASHGYEREGLHYHVTRGNADTIVLFCHFGLECILLSHLINVSPMVLWHGLCAAPSSVTTVVTEERRPGIASFRTLAFGEVAHLRCAGEEPSFAARFCEQYGLNGERID